jgi:hypothetical protein
MSAIIPTEHIATAIHWIRQQKVILDRDLADLYGVEDCALKHAARRNPECFPGDFMFTLNSSEINHLEERYDEQFAVVFEAIKRLPDENEPSGQKNKKTMGVHP